MRSIQMNGWLEKASGVWSTTFGNSEDPTPLGLVNRSPMYKKIKEMGEAPFPFGLDAVAAQSSAKQMVISLPLSQDEKIYGLGLQFQKMNHRGRTRYLRINSDPKEDTGESHAPVPFYVSSRGYGVLVNTSRIVTIYCGSTVRKDSKLEPVIRDRTTSDNWLSTPMSDTVEIVLPPEGAEILVFAGNSMLDAVRKYNLYCGGGVLPPRWGLGFWYRTSTFFNDKQVQEEALEFRKRDMPCDVIGLEPGWHSSSYPTTYEWSAERFPAPADFINQLKAAGFRVNLWENPYVAPMSRIHSRMEPLSGSHTVWGGLVPDYTLPEAQEILKDQHMTEHVDIGVSGYKIDECDGSELTQSSWMFPAHASFPSGTDGEQMRQVYGLLLQKMTADLFRQRDRRTYGLVRASNAGSSSLPYVLYSDLYDDRQFVRALCNSSFSGLLWTPELREAENAAEFVRRLQVVCFSPLAGLNAWASGIKPWSYPEVEGIVRKFLQLRMRLMPYLYSLFAQYYFDGTPPIRAMVLDDIGQLSAELRSLPTMSAASSLQDFNSTDAAYGQIDNRDIDDQFMVGDSLLIAPLFKDETSRNVALPKGNWYDFETGACLIGGQTIRISAGLEKLPIYVRDGAIIPMMPALSHAPHLGEQVPLEIRHYGSADGHFLLYDDDGETFAYEKGSYRWITLNVKTSPDGERKGSSTTVTGEGWNSSYSEMRWNFI